MEQKRKSPWREWIETLVIAFILAMAVRAFVMAAFKIPTGSMIPTLMVGDKIFVNKFIYRFTEPKRGDIIVFKSPEDLKKDFVKRLIGLEGETIEISNGRIIVNGKPIVELDGTGKEIVYYNRGAYGAEGKTIKVPANSYFALGDNSNNSRDSREWGFVPKKYMIGKAFLIWWPPNRIKVLK